VDGYNVVIGGGTGSESGIGRALKNGVAATEAPELIENVLSHWIKRREGDESFHVYSNRLSAAELESLC
jgi:ferredoxin-nitrite reductase